jgi:hypothetical protein
MECNIEKTVGQTESSSGKTVMRAPVKDEKERQRLVSGFSIEIELGLDRTQYVPLMQQSYIQEGLCLSTFGL